MFRPLFGLIGILTLSLVMALSLARQNAPISAMMVYLQTDADDRNQAYLMRMYHDGSHPRQLSELALKRQPLRWSPDGKRIIFSASDGVRNTHLYQTRAHGHGTIALTSGEGYSSQPAFSPDGTTLAYQYTDADGRSGIYQYADPPRLISHPSFASFEPHWLPDGDWIVYAQHVSGDNFQLYRMRPDGSERGSLAFAYHSMLTISPDGRWLAFNVRTNYSGDFEIYRMDLQGDQAVERLTGGTGVNVTPRFSPDGDWIAFASSRDGNTELYQMRPDGADITRLTATTSDNGYPQWSPDGRWLIFERERRLYRLNTISGKANPIAPQGSFSASLAPIVDLSWRPLPLGMIALVFLSIYFVSLRRNIL